MRSFNQTDDEADSSDPLFDAMLCEADWPDVGSEQLARLRSVWAGVRRRRRRHRRLIVASSLLVCAALGAGLWQARWQRPSPSAGVLSVPEHATRPTTISDAEGDVPKDQVNTSHALFEEVVVLAFEQRLARQRRITRKAGGSQSIEEVLARINGDPTANVDDLAKPLLGKRSVVERQLAFVIRQGDTSQRLAAIRLLTRVCTWRSYALLFELREWTVVHVDVVRALGRLSSPRQLAKLARVESDPPLRRELIGLLLDGNSSFALRMYLEFVANPVFSADAISSLERVSNPPIEDLFAYLDSSRVSLRIASARVLGRLDDPAISARLVDRVLNQVGLREALIALTESKNETAQHFLAQARRDVVLTASVRAARRRVAMFSN